jgi:hypothetical protein
MSDHSYSDEEVAGRRGWDLDNPDDLAELEHIYLTVGRREPALRELRRSVNALVRAIGSIPAIECVLSEAIRLVRKEETRQSLAFDAEARR